MTSYTTIANRIHVIFIYPTHGWDNMGKIRISIPSQNFGFPYPVCKKYVSLICFLGEEWLETLTSNHLVSHRYMHYRNVPKLSDRQVWANSLDPDQNDRGLFCLPFRLHRLVALLFGKIHISQILGCKTKNKYPILAYLRKKQTQHSLRFLGFRITLF